MKNFISIAIIFVGFFGHAQNGNLQKANQLFDNLAFAAAIPYYENIAGTEFESYESKSNLAYCYLFTNNSIKAETLYRSILGDNFKSINYFYFATALFRNNKSAEAIQMLNKYAQLEPTDSKSQLWLAQSDFYKNMSNEMAYFNCIETNINTSHAEFGVYPYPNKDVALIVSSRKKTGFGEVVWGGNDDYFLELFFVQLNSDQSLTTPVKLESPYNSKKHEGPLCFSADGKKVFFTSNNRDKENTIGQDGIHNFNIYIADVQRSEWINIKEFPYNATNYSCGHPSLSLDGKTLFFSSDMPGGFGGSDIYSCSISATGEFGKPQNLGPHVNTSGQEMFPWISADNNLYFASNGRPGFGGLDIFVIPSNANQEAKNVGASINSMADDFALTFVSDKKGYVASNRNGSDDIYSFVQLRDFIFSVKVSGTVKDSKSKKSLAYSILTIKDENGNVVEQLTADANGLYSFDAVPGQHYQIVVQQKGYENEIDHIDVPNSVSDYSNDIGLNKQPEFGVRLLITDSQTKDPVSGASIQIIDQSSNQNILSASTSNNGDVTKALTNYQIGSILSLKIGISAPGYLTKNVVYNAQIEQNGIIQLHEKIDVSLKPVLLGADLAKTLGIKPIYFDVGKFNIRKDAAIELDKIVKVMNENPTMVIELGSHTDCRSSAASNMTLSTNRANSSAQYIKSRISNPDRIYGKGFGETKLLNDCGCEGAVQSNCTEEEHQLNRRTEFIIIKM